MPHPVLLIFNPCAAGGRAPHHWDRLRCELSRRSIRFDHVRTEHPGHAIALARTAGGAYEVVVAVGGDGTVNEVATGLLQTRDSRALLGILPLGTGNDIASQLGLPSCAEALAALAARLERSVDAIEVRWGAPAAEHIHYALCFAAVGFASELIKKTPAAAKRWLGRRLCYSLGFLRALRGFQAPLMQVRADGREFRARMFHVCAGNAEAAGGGVMRLSPGARMDDGQLEFCLIEALSTLEILREFPHLLRGSHIRHPKVRYFPGHQLVVDSDPPLELQLDGDLIGRTPALCQIRPQALRVLIPPRSDSAAKEAS